MAERLRQVGILLDIFGDPFRPVSLDPTRVTDIMRGLAQTIYEDRTLPSGYFDNRRMCMLADALEESGDDNADILKHCRGPGPHVRGCWVVDWLLGKS